MKIIKRNINGKLNSKISELVDIYDFSKCEFNLDYFKIEDDIVTDYTINIDNLYKDISRYGTIITDTTDSEENTRTKRIVLGKNVYKTVMKDGEIIEIWRY